MHRVWILSFYHRFSLFFRLRLYSIDNDIFDFEKFLQGDDYAIEPRPFDGAVDGGGGGGDVTQYLNLTDDQRKTLKKSASVNSNGSSANDPQPSSSNLSLLDKAKSMRTGAAANRPQQQIQRRNSASAEYGNVLSAIEGANEYTALPANSETSGAAQKKPGVIYDQFLPKGGGGGGTVAGYDKVVPPDRRHSGSQYNSIDVDSRTVRPGATIKEAVAMEVEDVSLEGSSSDNEVHVTNTKITGKGRSQYESVTDRLTLSPLDETKK